MPNRIKPLILTTIIVGVLFVAVSTLSAETPEPFKLDNGLTVILRPVPTANKVAFVTLYNIGEMHDPIGKSGMAHLMEHLYCTAAAGDTPARDVMQFIKRYPAGWNAQTGLDYTVIAGVVAPDLFSEELKDIAARMNALRITEADVEREVPRVRHELTNMYGGIPSLAGLNRARAQLHPVPQGGQRGGAIAHIQTITVDELQQFWTDYYKPNNAILVIAGKFDVDDTLKAIHQNLSPISSGKLPPKPHPKPQAKTGTVHRVSVKPVVPNATGVATIGYAAPPPGSKDYVPFLIVYARLLRGLQAKFRAGNVQPIFYPPLDDTTTFVLQSELMPEGDADVVLQELAQRLQTALSPELTPMDKLQAVSALAMLGTVDIADTMWSQNLYGLAFSIGRRHQLQIDGKALRAAIERVTDSDLQSLTTSIFAPEKRVTVIVDLEEEK